MFDKRQIIENTSMVNSTAIQCENFYLDKDLAEQMAEQSGNRRLLNKLVKENLERCEVAIYDVDFSLCRKWIDTVFNYGLNGIKEEFQEELYFYRCLMYAVSDEKDMCSDCQDFLPQNLSSQVQCGLLDDYGKIQSEEMFSFRPEEQVCVLNRFFGEGEFSTIIKWYEERNVAKIEKVEYAWLYFYSLSLFNIREYDKAVSAIRMLAHETNKPYHQLLMEVFEIHSLRQKFFDKNINSELKEKFYAIKRVLENNPGIIKGDYNLFLATRLGTAIYLGNEIFLEEYKNLSDDEKNSECAKFFYSMYYENIGDFGKALELNLSIKHIEVHIIHHRMICLSQLAKWSDVVECYNSFCDKDEKNAVFDGLYISALRHIDDNLYYEQLEFACEKYHDDVRGMCYIGIATEECVDDFNRFITPFIQQHIDDIMNGDSDWFKFTYGILLLHCNQNELCFQLIQAIKDYDVINDFSIRQFCESLYESKSITDVLQERISECFISNNKEKESFLQLKINALVNQMKIIEAIHCSEELYKLTGDIIVARNIVALVVNNCPDKINEYGKYYQELELTNDPDNLMAAAIAYDVMERIRDADRCAYNAILFQDNEEDYNFYESYVRFSLRGVYEHSDKKIEYEKVQMGSAVTLQTENGQVIVCIEDANDTNGRKLINAIGAKHIYNTDSLYHKIMEKSVDDTIIDNEVEYKIVAIIDKNIYAFHYATAKLEENPNPESTPIKMFKVSDGDDLIRQMRDVFPKTNGKEERLKVYHMEEGELGLPMEAIIVGNYDDYLENIRFLLWGKDQALYAGQVDDIDSMEDRIIVPTLSSLVILSEFQCVHFLSDMHEKVCIPESLLLFVQKRIKHMERTIAISPGKMYSLPDGKIAMCPPDHSELSAWKSILEACLDFRIEKVLDNEVAEFPLLEQISAESLFNQLKMDRSQLECMILAKKEEAILLSDDLFYRKLTTSMGIQNINSGCFLKYRESEDSIQDVLVKMSTSNYIYIPLSEVDAKNLRVVIDNLVNGKYKKKYYSYIFESIIKAYTDFFEGR